MTSRTDPISPGAPLFRVKVCGVTNLEDATAVVDAGGDAIGLNFYPGSRRYLSAEVAAEISAGLGFKVVKVGVFVNAAADEVCRLFDHIRLDLVQLHGDEPPSFLRQLGGRPVMKAFRIADGDFRAAEAFLAECLEFGCLPAMVLIDAYQADHYGGTGLTLDWQRTGRDLPMFAGLPLVLAGGLTPANVSAAIKTARPAAVDTASGVETSPGRKDHGLVTGFVQEAKRAFSELGQHRL